MQEKLEKISILLWLGKLKFSAQWSDLAPLVGNRTKFKIPSEIKPPLVIELFPNRFWNSNIVLVNLITRPKRTYFPKLSIAQNY